MEIIIKEEIFIKEEPLEQEEANNNALQMPEKVRKCKQFLYCSRTFFSYSVLQHGLLSGYRLHILNIMVNFLLFRFLFHGYNLFLIFCQDS